MRMAKILLIANFIHRPVGAGSLLLIKTICEEAR
jgi:hypothetical protein